jgi:hypothetical protein
LCGFRGGSVQSELDSFFAHLSGECAGAGLLRHVTDRAFAKARAKLHVPALWDLNAHLVQSMQDQGLLSLWKGHRLVCADATVLAPAQRACHRTRSLAAPSQRAFGLYLPGNEVMLHVAVGSESEGERQMLFDQLDRLHPGDVLVLDRGYPATWLVQLLYQRGIAFVIRCDSTHSWKAARDLLRKAGGGESEGGGGGGQSADERWVYLPTTTADKVATWELDGPAQMRVRLVRHISSTGRVRVLVTSLDEPAASAGELGDLYHGRWRIEEAFKRLKHRLGLESVSGLSQHALLVDVAAKVLADNMASLLNRSVNLGDQDDEAVVSRKVNRATAAKALSRCIRVLLLNIQELALLIRDWAAMMGRSLIRHVKGRSQPRRNTRYKPHPSQGYKRAA